MSPPSKKIKPNKDKTQRTIANMFGNSSAGPSSSLMDKEPAESESRSMNSVDESKQNILIDMFVDQDLNEHGNHWTFSFNFEIHFLASNSQKIDSEGDVEIEYDAASEASSAHTLISGTSIETEDDSAVEDDLASISLKEG